MEPSRAHYPATKPFLNVVSIKDGLYWAQSMAILYKGIGITKFSKASYTIPELDQYYQGNFYTEQDKHIMLVPFLEG